jgi:hypothetical protein
MEFISIVVIIILLLILIPSLIYVIFKLKDKKERNDNIAKDDMEIPNNLQTNQQTESITHQINLSKLSISKFNSSDSILKNSKLKLTNYSNVKPSSLKENQFDKCKAVDMTLKILTLNELKSAIHFRNKLDFQPK